jgi:hypothetical protein
LNSNPSIFVQYLVGKLATLAQALGTLGSASSPGQSLSSPGVVPAEQMRLYFDLETLFYFRQVLVIVLESQKKLLRIPNGAFIKIDYIAPRATAYGKGGISF